MLIGSAAVEPGRRLSLAAELAEARTPLIIRLVEALRRPPPEGLAKVGGKPAKRRLALGRHPTAASASSAF